MSEIATETPVTLSASAASQINAIMKKMGKQDFLRVAVEGGGCSGFSYKFDFAEAANADDLIIERDGARVLIDEMSLEFLEGSEIDYANELRHPVLITTGRWTISVPHGWERFTNSV